MFESEYREIINNLQTIESNSRTSTICDQFSLLNNIRIRLNKLREEIEYNKLHPRITRFTVGDLVHAHNHALSNKEAGYSQKLGPIYIGPYKVLQRLGPNHYLLQHTQDKTIIKRNVSQLRPYILKDGHNSTQINQIDISKFMNEVTKVSECHSGQVAQVR